MSKKQEKHLQKARQIKATKNKKSVNSNDLMEKIDQFVANIDLENQAKTNNASNVLNALISVQRLKKENELLDGMGNEKIEAIKIKYVSSDTPDQRLRIALIDRQARNDIGENLEDINDDITDALNEIRDIYKRYSKILSNYDDNNKLLTSNGILP